MKDRTYYDENGVEIQEGDLLKVYHFRHYIRKRKMYMYHVAVIKDGYWAGRDYNAEKTHYWLKSVANKETGIINGAEIISKPDYDNEDRLRAEGSKRLKGLQKVQESDATKLNSSNTADNQK